MINVHGRFICDRIDSGPMNRVATLYVEELKATTRGRFAWLGAGVVLLLIGGLATVATQDTWLDGYGLIAYFLVPLAFVPIAAAAIAWPRANRFVESLFTAPVDRADWLTAKVLVLLTLAALYYLALIPMMLVYVHHVGAPLLLRKFLWWTPGLLISSVAIGTLVGVLFIGRSVAAPAATGVGLLLAYSGMVPLQELLVAQNNGASNTARVALASPAVLLKNALGFAIVAPSVPSSTTMTWLSLAIVVAGAIVLAAWVFLHGQGVETWEATTRTKYAIAAGIGFVLVFPVLVADRDYERPSPAATAAPPIRAVFARGGSNLALTEPGAPLPVRCCGTILNRDAWPIGTDEDTRQDLLILLPVDAADRMTELHVEIAGEAGLRVVPASDAAAHPLDHLERHQYPADFGPATADGRRVERGWIARIPVVLNPTQPWDVGGDRYPLSVNVSYRVASDAQLRVLKARAAINAQVWRAVYEMAAASAVLPIACLVAACVRWRRTR